MSSQVVEEKSNEINNKSRNWNFKPFLRKMIIWGREVCITALLAAVTCAVVRNNPLKTRQTSLPVPFFNTPSLITDFYYGQVGAAFEQISEADISFVMYYAPWDSESRSVRTEFEKVADYFGDQIYFSAINCWYPEGECHQHFNKIQAYPVLLLYQQHFKGVHYRGVKDGIHMIQFLLQVMRPLYRIEQHKQLATLRQDYEAVVVAHIPFTEAGRSQGYHSYYVASMKALERDPFRDVGFAIITNHKAAARLRVPKGVIQLHLWNETIEYTYSSNTTSDRIIHWVFSKLHQSSVWVTPPRRKSITLSQYIEDGPVVILFTARNPLHITNPVYDMFREVSLEYNSCNATTELDILKSLLMQRRQEKLLEYKKLESECIVWNHQRTIKLKVNVDRNTSNITQSYQAPCISGSEPQWCPQTMSNFQRIIGMFSEVCYGLFLPKTSQPTCCVPKPTQIAKSYIQDSVFYNEEFHGQGTDYFGIESIVRLKENKCKKLHYASSISPLKFPKPTSYESSSANVKGLKCETNNTLSFLTIDSMVFPEFGWRLGIHSSREKSAVVIFDSWKESYYKLAADLNRQSLVNFILNFTSGRLSRSLYSKDATVVLNLHFKDSTALPSTCSKKDKVCIQEVTSRNFNQVVLDDSKTVVVFYTSPACGFCSSASFIYLTVAHQLVALTNLTFVRFDGQFNDLPWEFTVDTFPTFIIFPRNRKSESRAFPRDLPVTLVNLLHFVLSNAVSAKKRFQLAIEGQVHRYQMENHELWTVFYQSSHLLDQVNNLLLTSKTKHSLLAYQQWLIVDMHRTRMKLTRHVLRHRGAMHKSPLHTRDEL